MTQIIITRTANAIAAGMPVPSRAYQHDAGYDLRVLTTEPPARGAGHMLRIHTGIVVSIPPGWCGLIRERSSWAAYGLKVFGGVIDSGYDGEIVVLADAMTFQYARAELWNFGDRFPAFAQLLIVPCWSGAVVIDGAPELPSDARRGDRGFGSSDAFAQPHDAE